MSSVSGVTLQVGILDAAPVETIDAWLASRGFQPLAPVHDEYSGGKHPQVHVFGAGLNNFPEDDFAEFVLSIVWREPANVVLLINPEAGATRVFRPAPR